MFFKYLYLCKIYKFPPYLCKIYKFPPIFVQFTVFCLIYVFMYFCILPEIALEIIIESARSVLIQFHDTSNCHQSCHTNPHLTIALCLIDACAMKHQSYYCLNSAEHNRNHGNNAALVIKSQQQCKAEQQITEG